MKIEAGLRYIRRDGAITGATRATGKTPYAFSADGIYYTSEGRFDLLKENFMDLVSVYDQNKATTVHDVIKVTGKPKATKSSPPPPPDRMIERIKKKPKTNPKSLTSKAISTLKETLTGSEKKNGDISDHLVNEEDGEKYAQLKSVMDEAFKQASCGKGKERHGQGLPFQEQRMQTISRLIDSDAGMEFQAIKKLTEGLDMADPEARERELLGVINYVAGIVVFHRNKGKLK